MPPQPKDKPVWETKPLDLFDMVYNLALVYAGVVLPVIRSGFGVKAPAPFVYTFILLWAFAMCYPPFLLYIPVWLGFVAYRRITLDKRAHTRYRGHPWMSCLLPFVNSEFKGRVVEPWLVMAFGVYLKTYSADLAGFFIGSGIALYVVLLVEQAAIDARRRALHDAQLEAQEWADLEQGGDGWN